MAMTVESIRRVNDERTHLLLKEATFPITGHEYELLTTDELKSKRTVLPKGIDKEQFLSEGNTIFRNVADLVETIRRDVNFELENYRDAKLIYTIIDTFLQAQARLLNRRIGGLKEFMIDDFKDLTKLANMMLTYITMADRIDLMNAPKEETTQYKSIFDIMLGGKEDSTHVGVDSTEEHEDEGYQSPFSEVIKSKNRSKPHLNRLDRFNF